VIIVDFLRKLRSDGKAPRDKTPPSHLRNLFRFLFWSGKTKRDLAASIPRVAQPPRSTLPRYLKPEEVEKLLDAVWSADPTGRRNYAMLMILARLGLRAPEAIAIRLDDIDWRAATVSVVARKNGQPITLPLTNAVGAAIVTYLRRVRPDSKLRTLFLKGRAPSGALTSAAVSMAFDVWARRSGLVIPVRGTHCLRHSYAITLLRRGISLKVIGDLLGHRSSESTCVYLRLATDDLRGVALELPRRRAGNESCKVRS